MGGSRHIPERAIKGGRSPVGRAVFGLVVPRSSAGLNVFSMHRHCAFRGLINAPDNRGRRATIGAVVQSSDMRRQHVEQDGAYRAIRYQTAIRIVQV